MKWDLAWCRHAALVTCLLCSQAAFGQATGEVTTPAMLASSTEVDDFAAAVEVFRDLESSRSVVRVTCERTIGGVIVQSRSTAGIVLSVNPWTVAASASLHELPPGVDGNLLRLRPQTRYRLETVAADFARGADGYGSGEGDGYGGGYGGGDGTAYGGGGAPSRDRADAETQVVGLMGNPHVIAFTEMTILVAPMLKTEESLALGGGRGMGGGMGGMGGMGFDPRDLVSPLPLTGDANGAEGATHLYSLAESPVLRPVGPDELAAGLLAIVGGKPGLVINVEGRPRVANREDIRVAFLEAQAELQTRADPFGDGDGQGMSMVYNGGADPFSTAPQGQDPFAGTPAGDNPFGGGDPFSSNEPAIPSDRSQAEQRKIDAIIAVQQAANADEKQRATDRLKSLLAAEFDAGRKAVSLELSLLRERLSQLERNEAEKKQNRDAIIQQRLDQLLP